MIESRAEGDGVRRAATAIPRAARHVLVVAEHMFDLLALGMNDRVVVL